MYMTRLYKRIFFLRFDIDNHTYTYSDDEKMKFSFFCSEISNYTNKSIRGKAQRYRMYRSVFCTYIQMYFVSVNNIDLLIRKTNFNFNAFFVAIK